MKEINNLVTVAKLKTQLELSIKEALKGTELTSSDFHIINAAYVEPSIAADLATATGLKGPSISRINPKLKERKLIKSCNLNGDNRYTYVTLTKKGEKLFEKIQEKVTLSLTISSKQANKLAKDLKG